MEGWREEEGLRLHEGEKGDCVRGAFFLPYPASSWVFPLRPPPGRPIIPSIADNVLRAFHSNFYHLFLSMQFWRYQSIVFFNPS